MLIAHAMDGTGIDGGGTSGREVISQAEKKGQRPRLQTQLLQPVGMILVAVAETLDAV